MSPETRTVESLNAGPEVRSLESLGVSSPTTTEAQDEETETRSLESLGFPSGFAQITPKNIEEKAEEEPGFFGELGRAGARGVFQTAVDATWGVAEVFQQFQRQAAEIGFKIAADIRGQFREPAIPKIDFEEIPPGPLREKAIAGRQSAVARRNRRIFNASQKEVSARLENNSETRKETGEMFRDYRELTSKVVQARFPISSDLIGNVFDDPALLNPLTSRGRRFLGASVIEQAPRLATTIGAALVFGPVSAAFGAATLEAVGVYDEALDRGKTAEEALSAYSDALILGGTMNAVALDFLVKKIPVSTSANLASRIIQKVAGQAGKALPETITEVLEEAVQEGILGGSVAEGLKQGLNVVPATFMLSLFAPGANGQNFSSGHSTQIADPTAEILNLQDLQEVRGATIQPGQLGEVQPDKLTVKDLDNAINLLEEDEPGNLEAAVQVDRQVQTIESVLATTVKLETKPTVVDDGKGGEITVSTDENGTVQVNITERQVQTPEQELERGLNNITDADLSNPESGAILNPLTLISKFSGKDGLAFRRKINTNVLEQLSGVQINRVRRLTDEPTQPALLVDERARLTTPEFALRNDAFALPFASGILEGQLYGNQLSEEDGVQFRAAAGFLVDKSKVESITGPLKDVSVLKSKAATARQKLGRPVMEALKTNDRETVDRAARETPDVLKAALALNSYFDSKKEAIKKVYRARIRIELPDTVSTAFEQVLAGKDVADVVKKNKKLKADLLDALKRYQEINEWGIDDYITNIELGSTRIVAVKEDPETGAEIEETVGFAVTERAAVQKVKDLATRKELGEAIKEIRIVQGVYNQDVDLGVFLTAPQRGVVVGNIAAKLAEEAEGVQKAALREITNDAIRGIIKLVAPKAPKAGALKKRKGTLKGEDNIFEVLEAYSYSVNKTLGLTLPNARLAKNLHKLQPIAKGVLLQQATDAAGVHSISDKILDSVNQNFRIAGDNLFGNFNLFKQEDFRPGTASRFSGKLAKLEASMKLGWRPMSAFINKVGGEAHTYAAVGHKYWLKAGQWIKTEEGKAFESSEEALGSLGSVFVEDAQGKRSRHSKVAFWHPLKMFNYPERGMRRRNLAANYLLAKETMGMDDMAAREFARRSMRYQLLTYNSAAIPAILRSPQGKVIGQFKRYLIGEIEFIRTIAGNPNGGRQILRYMGAMMAMAGPRGAIYMLRSLPFLAAFGILDSVEKAAIELDKKLPFPITGGIPGILGADVASQAVPQLGNRPEDWAGPALSDMLRIQKQVITPFLNNEGVGLDDIAQVFSDGIPMWGYMDSLIESVVDKDGDIYDKHGNFLYRISNWWERGILAAGAAPVDLSFQKKALFILQTEDRRRKARNRRNRKRLIKDFNAGREFDPETLNQLIQDGGLGGLEEAIANAQLEPAIRDLQRTPAQFKEDVIKLHGF